jgi:hypothetical protein
MFRPQAQAETHSRPGRALRGSRTTHAEAHSNRRGPPRASRTISKNFFYFLFLDYKHKRKPAAAQPNATHNFIDSP